jgi:zinc D-Ala-D-Ala carboxypeptidase
LTASQIAARFGIDNYPPPDVYANLQRLAETLERVRAILKFPILVSSGYRSPKVNFAVGGSDSSAHMKGLAADFICPGFGTPFQVCEAILDSDIEFDQLIHEYGRWIHLGLSDGVPRLQPLTAKHTSYGTHFTVGIHSV